MIDVLCMLDSYYDYDESWLMKVPLELLDEGKVIFHECKFYRITNVFIADLLTICIVEDYSDKKSHIKLNPKIIDNLLLDYQVKLLEKCIYKNKENNND